MKIAVIGAGVSGLVSAYLLSREHEVVLYEKENRVGGHAHTHTVPFGDTTVSVDTGFMVFNPPEYPHLCALFKALGTKTQPTSMTFSVHIPNEVTFASNFPTGIFAMGTKSFSPRYLNFLLSIIRFNMKAKVFLLTESSHEITLKQFLEKHKLNTDLAQWYLLPMIGSIWSCSLEDMAQSPALEVFAFLQRHQLLSIFSRPKWRTVRNGSQQYVDALVDILKKRNVHIELESDVRVSRNDTGVLVTNKGVSMQCDAVVFGTHGDTALALLQDPSDEESRILSSFTYSANDTYLHSDETQLPAQKHARASWNYTARKDGKMSLSYDMNILQSIDKKYPLFVTLNPETPINPELIHARMSYTHPNFSLKARAAARELAIIQGKRNTYFAGSHWGSGFHEDGAASAVAVAKALGVEIVWTP